MRLRCFLADRLEDKKKFLYFAYNKPISTVTHSPQKGDRDITKVLGRRDIFPVGRLEERSSGLMILTNDGRITDRLLNPSNAQEQEYIIKTIHPIAPNLKWRMEKGVFIGDYITKPCVVSIEGRHTFRIILTESKKHQIRRMCTVLV